jgi:hypothetical protein
MRLTVLQGLVMHSIDTKADVCHLPLNRAHPPALSSTNIGLSNVPILSFVLFGVSVLAVLSEQPHFEQLCTAPAPYYI